MLSKLELSGFDKILILSTLAILVLEWFAFQSESFQNCRVGNSYSESQQTPEKIDSSLT
jgi:hypothetical protein